MSLMLSSVMMGPMRLGRRSRLVLVLASAPALAGCALIDLLDGGSTLEQSFEYLPGSTFKVRFIEQRAVEDGTKVLSTQLDPYADMLADTPLGADDLEWEAYAAWGDDPEDPSGEAFVWKVGDDVDFDELADDLEDNGYARDGDRAIYSADPATIDRKNLVNGVYPAVMGSVLLDEGEQLVVGSFSAEPLADVAEVVADDSDSLADEGSMDDLLEAAEDDPGVAWLTTAGPALCATAGPPVPERFRAEYADLGRPTARALFVSHDDVVDLALLFDDEEAAEDDREAREALVERGVDPLSLRPFEDLGDFDVRRDGDLVIVEEDFDGGPRAALRAETAGVGPGYCFDADE